MSRLAIAIVVALLGILGGCVGTQPPTTSAPPTASPTPTPRSTAPSIPSPTAAPTDAPATPTPTPTAQVADPCASSTEEDPATPPDAALTGADGTAVAGRVGSYTYCDIAVDALPPRADNLTAVRLATDVIISTTGVEGFLAYRAGYWPAAEWQGDEISYASDELAAPVEETTFEAPPSGDWMLAVSLTFNGGGDAIYYWHVTVP